MTNPLRGVDWLSYNRSTLPQETRAEWEAAIAAFFATRTKAEIATEGLRRGINACVVNEPADVLADPHLAAREFLDTPDGLPERFADLSRRRAGRRSRHSRRRTARAALRRARARFRLGAGRLDHHQDARRSGRRDRQDRKPDAAGPRPDRRPGLGLAARQFRRQALVRASQQLEAQPHARHEAPGGARACSSR